MMEEDIDPDLLNDEERDALILAYALSLMEEERYEDAAAQLCILDLISDRYDEEVAFYTDTGVFSIYFGCDSRDADRCLELTHGELRRLCDAPLTTLQLAAAKKQLMGQVGVSADNFESTALGMAKTFLHNDSYEGTEALYRRIEALTAQQLWDISNELFHKENLTTLIYR